MQTHLLVFALSVGTAFGQISDPVPPAVGTWTSVHARRLQDQFRQPAPFPIGGFWVVEENAHSPSVIHYYTSQGYQLRTDTLRHKRPDLKSRAVVARFNQRLFELLEPVAIK